ncbi:hypothetical protein ACWKTQ_27525 [Bacillus thuringiensis]
MDFFNFLYLNIPFNFKFVFYCLLIYIVVNFFVRYALYFFSPSSYIGLGDKIIKWKYNNISQTNKSWEIKERKMEKTKIRIERILCVVATIILVSKHLLNFLSKPIVLLFLFCYGFKFITFDVSNTINLYEFLKPYQPNDQFTLKIINSTMGMLRIIAPLSLPFYYFAYREQKTISDSSLNGRTTNTFFVLFLLFSFSSIGYAMTIVEAFSVVKPSELTKGLDITYKYGGDLALISLYFILGLYFLYRAIAELLNSITLKKLVDKKINKVYFNYLLMSFGHLGFRFFKKNQYEYLSYQLETVYQALIQSADKNLGNVYGNSFKEWSKVLDYMLIEYRLASFDTTTKHLYLLNKYKQLHISFYRTILKNHKSLIMDLVKQHKIEDAKDAINKLLEYIPSPTQLASGEATDEYYDKYLAKYYVTLYELIIYLYDNKNVGVDAVLGKINNESQTSEVTEREGIIRNLQSLIIKTIENNDVKMLSSLSYYMNNFFNQNNTFEHNGEEVFKVELDEQWVIISEIEDESLDEEDTGDINEELVDGDTDTESESGEVVWEDSGSDDLQHNELMEQKNKFLYGSIFILLQSLLKSIELTHYKSTGFLIKFLITSYDSDTFNKVFNDFYSSPYENRYLLKKDLYKDIDEDFHMNENVKDYVLLKLFILVYAQQKYVIKNSVDFWEFPTELLDISLVSDRNYLDYMFKKLERAKKEYGLMFLEDDEFMEELKTEFGLANKNENKTVVLLEAVLKMLKKSKS